MNIYFLCVVFTVLRCKNATKCIDIFLIFKNFPPSDTTALAYTELTNGSQNRGLAVAKAHVISRIIFGQSEKTFPSSNSDWNIRAMHYDVTRL